MMNKIFTISEGYVKKGGHLDPPTCNRPNVKIQGFNPPKNMYLAVAYRYGFNTIENYIVFIGIDKDLAIESAKNESKFRGGKYSIKIYSFDENGNEDSKKEIFYIPSLNMEKDLMDDENEWIDSIIGFEFRIMLENNNVDLDLLKKRFDYFSNKEQKQNEK